MPPARPNRDQAASVALQPERRPRFTRRLALMRAVNRRAQGGAACATTWQPAEGPHAPHASSALRTWRANSLARPTPSAATARPASSPGAAPASARVRPVAHAPRHAAHGRGCAPTPLVGRHPPNARLRRWGLQAARCQRPLNSPLGLAPVYARGVTTSIASDDRAAASRALPWSTAEPTQRRASPDGRHRVPATAHACQYQRCRAPASASPSHAVAPSSESARWACLPVVSSGSLVIACLPGAWVRPGQSRS
jgi:hypothetical protein